MRLVGRFRIFALSVLLVLLALSWSCGPLGLDWAYIWDDTCYDCRTVCEGSQGADRDDCLSACHDCQGYSICFSLLEWDFKGQALAASDWDAVDCSEVE